VSLIDLLRSARAQPISIIHEFKLFYDPGCSQVHAFVEGQADKTFYSHFVTQRLLPSTRLYLYDCKGKRSVLDTMTRLKLEYPDARTLLYFVDKDLDDLLEFQPVADSLFCTEVYSIENYLMEATAVLRWFEESWRLSNVRFELGLLIREFEDRERSFIRLTRPIMAWILAHRRLGNRPMLSQLDLTKLIRVEIDGSLKRSVPRGGRVAYLDKVARVRTDREVLIKMRECIATISDMKHSAWLRGKFALWFLLAFMKATEKSLRVAAEEAGGTISCQIQTHEGNLLECLVSRIRQPRAVAAFLDVWMPFIGSRP
jgi:hypothetical protein